MPKYTRSADGVMRTSIVPKDFKVRVTAEQLARYNTMARALEYKDFQHWLDDAVRRGFAMDLEDEYQSVIARGSAKSE